MNLTDDEVLKFISGVPVLFDDVCAIYPLTLHEIITVGYSVFQQYLGILISEKPVLDEHQDSEFKKVIAELTDFQYFLMMTQLDANINVLVKEAFKLFTHEEVTFSLEPPQIIIGPIEEQHFLNENNFYEFQRILRRMYFIEQDGEEIVINADDPPHVRRLKEKMRMNREKVRKAKAKQSAREKTELKFSDLIGSICINNCGLNMENIWNITYYAFHDQLKRMGWRDQFNINNQAAMAGAKIKKSQLKHWMRSIASSDKS